MRLSVLSAPLIMASATLARSPLRRGETTDTCANLDAHLVFPDVDGKQYDAGRIHAGLCISQIDRFIGHYNVTEAATKVVGTDEVKSTLTDLIKQDGVQCSYPPHALPTVTSSDECGFICTEGFQETPTNHPTSCVCLPPMQECNGVCGDPSLDCTTKPPVSRRENTHQCADDLTMCGAAPDSMSGKAYKCVDIMSDARACGGCTRPSLFGGSSSTNGVDCHTVSNVDKVSCLGGKCFIQSCLSGFTVTGSNDGCVAQRTTSVSSPVNGASNDVTTSTQHAVRGGDEVSDATWPSSSGGEKPPMQVRDKRSLLGELL